MFYSSYVYHLFNKNGDLLYVGSTVDPKSRLAGHKNDPGKPWRGDIDRLEVVSKHGTRDDAFKAEGESIARDNPIHNKKRPRVTIIKPIFHRVKGRVVSREIPLVLDRRVNDTIKHIKNSGQDVYRTIDDIVFFFFKNYDLYLELRDKVPSLRSEPVKTIIPVSMDTQLKIEHIEKNNDVCEVVQNLFLIYAANNYKIPENE